MFKNYKDERRIIVDLDNLSMKDNLTEDEISILADIAYLVEKGSVFEKDYKLAKKIYEKCASFGNATALNNLGWLYQNGFGVKKDIEKAEEYFFQAAVRGNSLALVNLGNIYEFDEHKTGKADWKIARTWYLRGAMAGEDKAKMNYANALHYGYGGPKDRVTAFFIFKELAGKVKGAYFYLGLYYENGFVVKKDVDMAIKYYKAGAIEDGDGYCFTHLGNILNSDKKNEYTDYENAAKCYLSAIQHEDLLGIVNIGYMYERGRVTGKKDLESALKWYQLGAQECEPNCIDMLEKHNVKKTSKLDYEISDLIEQLIEDFESSKFDEKILSSAVEILLKKGHCTTSILQRNLKIGYGRAMEIINKLEDMKVISADPKNGKPRAVLIKDVWEFDKMLEFYKKEI